MTSPLLNSEKKMNKTLTEKIRQKVYRLGVDDEEDVIKSLLTLFQEEMEEAIPEAMSEEAEQGLELFHKGFNICRQMMINSLSPKPLLNSEK
jgi:hypothetical protein